MDTLNHGVMGYIISDAVGLPIEVSIISGIIGMMPDIIGYMEKVIKKKPDAWSWYVNAHYEWKFLYVIPSYGLHICIDRLTHGAGKRWWKLKERLWIEVLTWILMIGYFIEKSNLF